MSYRTIWVPVGLLLAFLWVLASTAAGYANVEPPPPLFSEPLPEIQQQVEADSLTLRSRQARITLTTLPAAGQSVQLNLFADATFTAEIDAREAAPLGGQAVHGRIAGHPLSEWTLVERGGLVSASVRLLDAYYQVQPLANGQHQITEIDLSALPSEATPLTLPDIDGKHAAPAASEAPLDEPSPQTIDLLVAYTPEARASAGGTANLENQIALAVAEINQGYAQSGIVHRLRLVRTAEISYDEFPAGGSQTEWTRTLQDAATAGNPLSAQLHPLRDQSGADVVTLLVEENYSYCGIAYVMQQANSTSFASLAYSVVARACIPNLSLGHELGHLMGAQHNIENAGFQGYGPYSYGYWAANHAFRTVMAYNCPTSCPRINYWSNPVVSYAGQPAGTASADNHLTLNNTAAIVAAFRQSAADAPAGLQVSSAKTSEVILSWTPVGFETILERRIPAVSEWAALQTMPAGTNLATDTDVICSRTYEYRLQSFRSGWYSPYSNVVSATSSCPTCAPAATLSCDRTISGTTSASAATDRINSYPWCPASPAASGPEYAYTFTAAQSGVLTVSLDASSAERLNLYTLGPNTASCDTARCSQWADRTLQMAVEAGSRYTVIVDGNVSSSYSLTTSCDEFSSTVTLPTIQR